MAVTTNYSWVKPTVAGDTDAWGGELNADLDAIDTQVKATDTIAQAALPKAGGVAMTGVLISKTQTFAHNALNSITGATNVDLTVANSVSFTNGGSVALTLTNVPAAGALIPLFVEVTNGGSAAITWFGGIKTTGAAGLPTLTSAGKDVLAFTSRDGGATWLFVGVRLDVR